MTAPTRARKLSADEVSAALISLGLKLEEKPIDGFAFSITKQPHHAVAFWKEHHGGTEPTRFYANGHSYTLSD